MKRSIGRVFVAFLVTVVGMAVVAPIAGGQSQDPAPAESSDPSANPRSPAQGSTGPDGVTPQQEVGAQAAAAVGGPVVIMGIDAEDGGVGGHGPITTYQNIVTTLSGLAKNSGAGILVLGGNKASGDQVTMFWDAIASGTGIPVTYSNGAAVATQSFAGFRIVAVVSGDDETSSGGLNKVECDALAARQQDFFNHVNAGGGLLVFAQDVKLAAGCEYAFFGGFGAFTFTTGGSYNNIAPTPAGLAAGVTDDLDVNAWHDTYTTFPAFLQVLATVDDPTGGALNGKVAALGGASVCTTCVAAVEVVPTFTG